MIGIDIESIERFNRLYLIKPKILQRIFTSYEWEYATKKRAPQTLTGIWCAKEAVLKALFDYGVIDLRGIEIRHHKDGSPYVYKINNFEILDNFEISLSISHTKDYATAVCIANKLF